MNDIDPTIIGQITLRVSFFIYLFFLIPQVIHNLRRKSVEGLSFSMHLIFLTAFVCDMGYGLGRQMEWEYCTVSIIGVISLSLQHLQFGLLSQTLPRGYKQITIAYILLLITIITALLIDLKQDWYYTLLGFIAMLGWLSYLIPQITTHYKLKNTDGLSKVFLILGIMATLCDIVSAYTLNWGLPNKIGAPVSLLLKLIIICQILQYRKSLQK